jgi:hypothetical protein
MWQWMIILNVVFAGLPTEATQINTAVAFIENTPVLKVRD